MRIWWLVLKKKFKRWVSSYKACQNRGSFTPKEIEHVTGKNNVSGCISMDVIHIEAGPSKYLLVARDDLSG